MRKKTAKGKAKSLPAKTLGAKAAKGVKGGNKGSSDVPTESISFNFTKIQKTYTEQ